MVTTAVNRKKMACAKSEKATWLKYTVQPFVREFFGFIYSVQLFGANDSQVFLSKTFIKI